MIIETEFTFLDKFPYIKLYSNKIITGYGFLLAVFCSSVFILSTFIWIAGLVIFLYGYNKENKYYVNYKEYIKFNK